MKLAKASEADLNQVREFFQMIEEIIEYGTYTPDDPDLSEEVVDAERFMELVRKRWNEYGPGVGSSWRRVVFGCETLIANCCDPDADVLEWRPEIRAFIEQLNAASTATAAATAATGDRD